MTPTPSIPDSIPRLAPDIPAEAFAADYVLMAAIAIIATLVLLAGVVWLLRSRYGSQRSTPAPTAEQLALAAIHQLEQEELSPRAFSIKLSLILRTFLAGQTKDPALYETHEEFSQRLDSLASLPASCQYDMRCLLEQLAEQKYCPPGAEGAQEQAATLLSQASELVKRVTADQAREAAERARA